jgi:hypothetical protein
MKGTERRLSFQVCKFWSEKSELGRSKWLAGTQEAIDDKALALPKAIKKILEAERKRGLELCSVNVKKCRWLSA